jgi:cell division GTPase FtsZ
MKILLLSAGGGGGNILRSLKALFERDLTVTHAADPDYADRLRRAVTTRFMDTNEFSLMDVPADERLLIGARTTGRLGARHNPDVARQALEESKTEVAAIVRQHTVVILIGTGGKGTGAGTMFPLAQLAREYKKLVVPIFVRPSFERHEVDKRRYDHASRVVEQFDAARIRLIEILNDRGYDDRDPQPQETVWERMNVPIARGLRGLIYVLWDLSQVDPSDLSTLFAGEGRLRIGFAEIDPPAGHDPTDHDVDAAIARCCANPYYTFSRAAGTSLICIQGEWSNVVDAKIKSRLAASAMGGRVDSPFTPLHARATRAPRPWGVTALFAEHTGTHPPLDVEWTFAPDLVPAAPLRDDPVPPLVRAERPDTPETIAAPVTPAPQIVDLDTPGPPQPPRSFSSLWEFAIAVNRSDPAALELASNGSDGGLSIDRTELRKLVGTVWFRSVFQRLSEAWRNRLFEALRDQVTIGNCLVKVSRRTVPLRDVPYSELGMVAAREDIPESLRADVHLLLAVGRLWGEDAVRQCQFSGEPQMTTRLGFGSILGVFR